MIADYPHFLRLARRLQWDEAAIALGPDAAAFATVPAGPRERIRGLVAGFVVGELRVAHELAPFAAAAADERARRCFAAQATDEARHARFFARIAEVAEVSDAEPLVDPAFRELLDVRLPALAGALSCDRERLDDAVGLYHMVIEGVAFTAGLYALERALVEAAVLPGALAGVGLVLRDERWHVGFGVRCLVDLGVESVALTELLAEGERAIEAWGDVVDDESARRALATHRRRLGALPAMQAYGLGGSYTRSRPT